MDGLTSQLVVCADDGSLSNAIVQDEGRLDLSGRQTMSSDVDDV